MKLKTLEEILKKKSSTVTEFPDNSKARNEYINLVKEIVSKIGIWKGHSVV